MRNVDLALWADYDVIGRAEEFEERVKSENVEFNALWIEMEDRSYFLRTFETDALNRYEQMLGLPSVGSMSARRKRVFAEWNRRVIWTERSLREYLDRVVRDDYSLTVFHDRYTVEFELELPQKWAFLHKRLREIIPANLGIVLRVRFKDSLYFGGIAQKQKAITIDWNCVSDTETENTWNVGGLMRSGRIVSVPPSTFDRSRVDGTIKIGGWITMRRWVVCNTVK